MENKYFVNYNASVKQLVDLPIFYINLDRSKERFDIFNGQLQKHGIPKEQATRVSAIDGLTLDISRIENRIHKDIINRPNTIACALSHIKAIKCAYEDPANYPYVIIMEDDCNFEYVPYQKYKLSDIVSFFGQTYNIIQLATTSCINFNNYLKNTENYIIPNSYRDSTGAYMINRQGMKNILNAIADKNTEIYVADITIYELAKTSCYLTKPYFTYFNSSILNTIIHNYRNTVYEDNNKLFWDNYYNLSHTEKIKNKIQRIREKQHQSLPIFVYIFKLANEYSKPLINRIIMTTLSLNVQYTNNQEEADILFIHYIERHQMMQEQNGLSILINGESKHDETINFDIYIDSFNSLNYFHIYYPEMFQSSMIKFAAHKSTHIPKKEKTKFCAYMYSYDEPHRVHYFKCLSAYQKVDALGQSMNNTMRPNDRFNENFKDIAVELYIDYKFVLALENVKKSGYVTEKLLLPLLAHSIPIYYGAPDIFKYVNKKRVIYIDDYKTDQELLAYIKEVDTNPALYQSIIGEDWFLNNYTFESLTQHLLDERLNNLWETTFPKG